MRKSNRAAAGAAAWRAVQHSARPGAPGLGERAAALPRMLMSRLRGRYDGFSVSRLLMYGLAIVYVASPIDLVPELFVPVLGLADDVGVTVWLATALMGESERFLEWERREGRVQGHVVG
ncbi:YkvA family protein [Streptomonospora algeriensis]|uniref:YkvA family protein n=1 Tax=Streptomonospora algeriensis TaxID=995084 RepID=A0ABW3BDF2_9ACTN